MEEAPAASELYKKETPIKNLNFEIFSNSKDKYSLNITCYNSYLNISIKSLNKSFEKEYEENFTLEQIKSISKYFLICESTVDVISSIEPNLKNTNLIQESNNLKLIISLNHPLCKEAIFIIPEKIKVYDQTELYHIISELKKSNQNQQEIINNLQKNVNDLTKRVKILENEIDELKNTKNEPQQIIDSNIIKNDCEKEKAIKNWINPNNNKIKFELLFRKSRDGFSCHTFHKKCDNKGPTLTLVETTKGFKFGGYTPYNFENELGFSPSNDSKTFIFSLNLMKKFTGIKFGPLIYNNPNFGPCFGKGEYDFMFGKNLNSVQIDNGSFLTKCELTNGEKGGFKVEELEVYKVI